MQLPNNSPGKLEKLSKHAVKTNHKSGKSDMLSQDPLWHMHCIKEAAKGQNIGQADTVK